MPSAKKNSKSVTKVEKPEVKEVQETVIKIEEEKNYTDESGSDVESVEATNPKKRGRKPKSKIVEVETSKQIAPKKRGRRPKDKTYTISNYKEIPNEMEEDNVILHLPVENEINSIENDIKIETNGVLKYDPNLGSLCHMSRWIQ